MLTKQIFRRSVTLAAVLALSVGMLPSLSIAEGASAYEQPELNPHIKSVIEADGYREKLVQYGALITYPRDTFPTRLRCIYTGVQGLLQTFKPDEIAFEELFFSKNVTTGIQVGGARGVALVACQAYTDKLFEYTPMQIKQAVVGYGGADKHQVQMMVRMLLGLKEIPRPDDAADAVACAITHAHAGAGREHFRIK